MTFHGRDAAGHSYHSCGFRNSICCSHFSFFVAFRIENAQIDPVVHHKNVFRLHRRGGQEILPDERRHAPGAIHTTIDQSMNGRLFFQPAFHAARKHQRYSASHCPQRCRENGQIVRALNMNYIWFELPDDHFYSPQRIKPVFVRVEQPGFNGKIFLQGVFRNLSAGRAENTGFVTGNLKVHRQFYRLHFNAAPRRSSAYLKNFHAANI
ncbi:hypothetical protein SDC9_69491 [bioreactor metagenome]|uniref:Uncharacterized protein n=1 Tax=bioreactor metagenome TaxID=1076179 RepID=A0A644Y3U4_9ZZZZ